MRINFRLGIWFPLVLLWVVCFSVNFVFAPSRAVAGTASFAKGQVDYYLMKYGKADPVTAPLVKRSYEIFRQVVAVADKRGSRLPRLCVVNSSGDPWAVALPDGHIVLSGRAVDICYRGVDQETGDARLAFVLGHELGHMAEDDFWHLETYRALAGDPEYDGLKKILAASSDVPAADKERRLAAVRSKEMRADDRGFMYAGISGFRVDMLVGDHVGQTDFFTFWMAQLPHQSIDAMHPKPIDRARLLQRRLENLSAALDFFRYGVRLAHFGKYDEAIYFLREFQKVFPSREVHNNLGYCLLQQALEEMGPARAYRYWLPSVLDLHTRAEQHRLSGARSDEGQLPQVAKELLEQAADHFKRACDMDKTYWPSRVNLSAVCFYTGRMYEARAVIEQAHCLAPDNTDILTLKALIMRHEDPAVDRWPDALKLLETITRTDRKNRCALYNLAVLLEERGRNEKAGTIWQHMASEPLLLPAPLRMQIIKRTGGKAASALARSSVPNPPWSVPIRIGTDLMADETAADTVKGWKQTPFHWFKDGVSGRMLTRSDGFSVLDIDGYIEMVVLAGAHLGSVTALTARFGPPAWSRNVMNGKLVGFSDHWYALIRAGRVVQVWMAEH